MGINNYANDVYKKIIAATPDNNCMYYEDVNILDVGVKVDGGWSSGKSIIEAFLGGLGCVNFGEREVSGMNLPTIDLYLDNPVKVSIDSFLNKKLPFSFCLTEDIPEKNNNMNLIVASRNSLVGSIYNSALAVPKTIEKLIELGIDKDNIIWAWGSCILATLSDELEISKKRQLSVLKYCSLNSIWVRENDEKLKNICNNWELGEIRLHNLISAKTHIGGILSKENLIDII